MSNTYTGCNGGDLLQEHGFYRLTFVPGSIANLGYGIVDDFSGDCQTLFDSMNGQPVIPAQGTPTIVDDPSIGRACVIDCVANWPQCQGQTVQQMAGVMNALTTPLDLSDVTYLQGAAAAANTIAAQPAAQAAAGATGAAVAATTGLSGFLASLSSTAKWAIVGLGIVVAFAIFTKPGRAIGKAAIE